MHKNILNFPQIIEDYHNLIQDLDSVVISTKSKNLATNYFSFVESLEYAFSNHDFSQLSHSWLVFEPEFVQKQFNIFSLSLDIGDMDYIVKKSYLAFLLKCQQSVAQLLFDVFVYDLDFNNQHKEELPAFILFVNWFEFPYVHMKQYFEDFTQSHFDSLSFYNHLPQLEFFLNALFLRSKSEVDMNTFDPEYLNFNTDTLQKVNEKQFYIEVILKNNSINLPEQFIDYIKFAVSKFLRDSNKKQSTLEAKEIKDFLKVYEKQKLEFLLPSKKLKFKTVKI